ncbi:DUF3040 domain-containing protein [Corynebacterium sp. H127]|uniref:DUF3040 domain-containing protein n=1 Tax=Corynebacterium sp. H127 TaxID=3133418 RepID=UPI0030A5AC1B
MSLSEQELRALREIEQSLLAEDPKFGATVSSVAGESRFEFSLKGVAIFVLGLVFLIGGIALSQETLWFVGLSTVGFLTMLGSGIWMLRSNDRVVPLSRPQSVRQRKPSNGSGFTGRMDERFRSRFEEGQ